MSHTPGPWIVCGMSSAVGGPVTHLAVNGSDGPAFGEFGVFVCSVSPVESINERDEANARLIAAAPDLLAALQELLDAGDHSVSATDDVEAMLRFGDAVNDAREAIRKATGDAK